MKNVKFNVWYCNERLGVFESLEEARKCIYNHPAYKKTYFTKKGWASSHTSQKENVTFTETSFCRMKAFLFILVG